MTDTEEVLIAFAEIEKTLSPISKRGLPFMVLAGVDAVVEGQPASKTIALFSKSMENPQNQEAMAEYIGGLFARMRSGEKFKSDGPHE